QVPPTAQDNRTFRNHPPCRSSPLTGFRVYDNDKVRPPAALAVTRVGCPLRWPVASLRRSATEILALPALHGANRQARCQQERTGADDPTQVEPGEGERGIGRVSGRRGVTHRRVGR